MVIFKSTLNQMLVMFSLVLAGFILRKCKILPENADKTISRLETFCIVPALYMATQMKQCTVESFKENYPLMLFGLVMIACAVAAAYPISRLFIKKSNASPDAAYQRNVYKYALTFGNYGFIGNFLAEQIWGEVFLYKYMLFTFFVGIVCCSWGLYILIPKDQSGSIWKNLKKGLLTPPLISLALGMILGLSNLSQYMPVFLTNALSSAGACMGPLAMVLAGFVIGGYNIKELLTNKKVYVASALRLLVIPAVLMLILTAFGTPKETMTLALIAFAAPLGLNTIVYPAAYGGDTKTGASMAMISTVLSVITLPLTYLVFIEIL